MADTNITVAPSLTEVALTTAASIVYPPSRASALLLLGWASGVQYSYDGTTWATVPADGFAVWQRLAETRGGDATPAVRLRMSSGTATVTVDAR